MNFPPELRDLVVDCLRNDTASLRACSLTCRAWLPRARHHLFRHVQIHPGRRGDAFKALLDRTPEIGTYIREFEISTVRGDEGLLDVSGRWPTLVNPSVPSLQPLRHSVSAAWLQSVLPSSPRVLSKVHTLKLLSLPITNALSELLGKHFSHVTSVSMDTCRAETFWELLSLPRALTVVHTLRLDGVTWYRYACPTPDGRTVSRPNTLKSLTLTEKVDCATVLNWLTENARHTELSSLSCYLSTDASAIAVQRLLDAIGSTLHDLAIGFSDVRDPTGTCKYPL